MKVRIDGRIVEREGCLVRDETYRHGGVGMSIPREEPELEEGERVLWALGDPIPTIIRIHDPFQY
ncbi:hypothetical protein LOY34_17015 [Pseudomonas sp. B21-009]|uniref:hypothetical protein n=1 Tax=Pseudomonas sp. B21-009 TaxID=2895470 RepID=UPI002160E677|nr:hypothetical protein [Pseudomonas sp. B21-009]UVM65033.1 hypothetical protein LOY34_17015 [Pseudomonas sp. B21-009]